jgi:hypothetical protein
MPSRLYGSDYFSAFRARLEAIPVQALLLSSPSENEIASVVRRHAGEIQAITGDSVTVMVPIDAAAPWVQSLSGLPSRLDRSPTAWILFGHFVALADVRWDELPALVVGRSAFTGSRLVMRTSAAYLLDQLRAVAVVSLEKGRSVRVPHLRRALRDHLPEQFGRPRTVTTSASADVVDSTLESLAGVFAFGDLPQLRPFESSFHFVAPVVNSRLSDLEEHRPRTALRTTRVANVAQAARQSVKQMPVVPPELEAVWVKLDAAGRSFLLTALAVAGMLGDLDFEADYGAAGLPLCNLFERLLNLAPVQLARQGRGVPMPARYVRFDPELPAGRGVVNTSKTEAVRYVDINQFDPDSPSGQHRFLTVGESRHLLRVMTTDRELRGPVHLAEITALEKVARKVGAIRNRHAHTVPMTHDAWMHVRELVLGSGVINALLAMADPLQA